MKSNFQAINQIKVISAATLLTGAGIKERSQGAVVMTAADIPASYALGASRDDTVWFRGIITDSNGTRFSQRASGILIRGQDHDYLLTAAHVVSTSLGIISTSNMTIGNGDSYLNNPGATTGVSSMYISPTYTTGDKVGGDYAFLQLATRISTPDNLFKIGLTPSRNTTILFSGYGLPGTMSGEPVTNTGNVMGFYASYSPQGLLGWNVAYDSGNFTGEHDSGYGSSRDSGGPVEFFNPLIGEWEKIGMTVAGNNISSTYFYAFDKADQNFYDYLNTTVIPVPEPSAAVFAWAGVVSWLFARRGKSARKFPPIVPLPNEASPQTQDCKTQDARLENLT